MVLHPSCNRMLVETRALFLEILTDNLAGAGIPENDQGVVMNMLAVGVGGRRDCPEPQITRVEDNLDGISEHGRPTIECRNNFESIGEGLESAFGDGKALVEHLVYIHSLRERDYWLTCAVIALVTLAIANQPFGTKLGEKLLYATGIAVSETLGRNRYDWNIIRICRD